MAVQPSAESPKREELFRGQEAECRKCGVQSRCCMSFAQDQVVSIRVPGTVRVMPKVPSIEYRQDLNQGERGSSMTGLGMMDRCNDPPTDLACLTGELALRGLLNPRSRASCWACYSPH